MCAGNNSLSCSGNCLSSKRTKLEETSATKVNMQTCKTNTDLLAISTIYTKIVLNAISEVCVNIKKTKYYKTLSRTTQPAHLVLVASVITVAMVLFPTNSDESSSNKPSSFVTLIYLAAFAMHFGAQMWMTFVSGLSLYFALGRHAFGDVQKVLFPKYFTLNTVLSLITLSLFARHHKYATWDVQVAVQILAMAVCFLTELIIRLYMAPPLLKLISAKNDIEKAAGVGQEIGEHQPKALVKCPHYMKLNKTFRKVHMAIAIGNMVTMACTILHLHYLSDKIYVL